MKRFNEYLNENKVHYYQTGDIVKIRYWLTGDITSVKIVEKKTDNYYIVSHKVKDGQLINAPNHGVSKTEIIGMVSSVGDELDPTDNNNINPNIRPDTSGIIPGWDSWSNDISF